jgi:4-hydroxy-4-methyl-2-oxoglutarate aldolase
MFRFIRLIMLLVILACLSMSAWAQLGMFSKEQRVMITSQWSGDRFPDGRPKVPDTVLKKIKTATAEEAWGVLREHKFNNQYAGGWKTINVEPGKRLVGRVVTAVFVPLRPDLNDAINKQAELEKRVGKGQNSWVIDTLQPNDVLVVDLFGKIEDGTFAGDNLSTSIMTKTGTGLIVDGAVRDFSGISEIKGFMTFVRDFHPSAIANVSMIGINVPIRIGNTTVMPGDVVVSDPDGGVTFIPPHLAQQVADTSERIQLHDEWGHMMLRQGKYTPGQIDSKWSPEMEEEFKKWAEEEKKKRQ